MSCCHGNDVWAFRLSKDGMRVKGLSIHCNWVPSNPWELPENEKVLGENVLSFQNLGYFRPCQQACDVAT